MDSRDKKVEQALFRAATGYRINLRKPIKVKEELNRPGEGKQVTEKVVMVQEQTFVAPLISAQLEWLRHRVPEIWGDGPAQADDGIQSIAEQYADVMAPPVPDRMLDSLEDEDGADPICEV